MKSSKARSNEVSQRQRTRQRVVERIRDRHEQGLSLKGIRRSDPNLYAAARRHYGSWKSAISAASIWQPPFLSRELLIADILARYQNGELLTNVWKEDPKFYSAAKSRFGSWQKALMAAEIPHAKSVPRKWTKQNVVDAIRQWHQEEESLTSVSQKHPSLYTGAIRHHGSWRNAVEAAGYRIRERREWSRETVIAELLGRRKQGLPLVGLAKWDSKLNRATYRYFGSLVSAVRAAGIDHPTRLSWTRESVLVALRERHSLGLPMRGVGKSNSSLYRGCHLFFESYDDALTEAGIVLPPLRIQPWSKEELIREIRDWHKNDSSRGSIWTTRPTVGAAVQRRLGNWNFALQAAGLEPAQREWSRHEVIREVRARAVNDVVSSGIWNDDPSLAKAARKYFGTCVAALSAAAVRKEQPKWSNQKVIDVIQNRHVRGLTLQSDVKDSDTKLVNAGRRYFGTWRSALEAAGISEKSMPQKTIRWSRELLIEELQKLHQQNIQMTSVRRFNVKLVTACQRHFGSWSQAQLAAGIPPELIRTRRKPKSKTPEQKP